MSENKIFMLTVQEKWSKEESERFMRDWDAIKQTTFMQPIMLEPSTYIEMSFLMKDRFNLIVVKSDNLTGESLDALGSHIRSMNIGAETLVLGMKTGDSLEAMTPENAARLFSALAAHLTDEDLASLCLQRKPA